MSADGVVGGDICGLGMQPDHINMTCSVRFRGKVAPTLSWSHDNVSDASSMRHCNVTNVTIPNSRVISTLVIRVNEALNASQCTCTCVTEEFSRSFTISEEVSNINWTSDRLKILCK